MKDYNNVISKGNQIDSLLRSRLKFCWVIALRAEATPIIEALNMKALSNDLLFPIYFNQYNGHALVISGIGATRSGAAATFLKAHLSIEKYASWINIGVSGYFEDSIGELYQAIKVMARDTGKTFFPGVRFSRILKTSTLVTVPKPEKDYAEPALYDMEAAGFCEISPSFSCNELTYVFKVVSDSPNHSCTLLTKKSVSKLIENQLPKIFEISKEISKIVELEKKRLNIPIEVQEFEGIIKFSATNRHRFRNIYRKWKAAFPDKCLTTSDFPNFSSKEIIAHLESQLLNEADNWTIK